MLNHTQIMSNTGWWTSRLNVAKMVMMLACRVSHLIRIGFTWSWVIFILISYHLIWRSKSGPAYLASHISEFLHWFFWDVLKLILFNHVCRPESKSGWTCLQHASCSMFGTVAPSSETTEKNKSSLQPKELTECLAFSSPTKIASSSMRTPSKTRKLY